MAFLYAMSDIHGELDVFKDSLAAVDLSNPASKLLLLGDYIDGGDQSCETLYFIKELQEGAPGQVIVLRGNHEEMFLDQLFGRDSTFLGMGYYEMQNYLSDKELSDIIGNLDDSSLLNARIAIIYKGIVTKIKSKHKDLIDWLRNLPYFYETDKQIFVHAGVDEEAEEMWRFGTEDSVFVWKHPHTTGPFYKDIIAGHIYTSIIAEDDRYHKVFWDEENHYFIDGQTNRSKFIPLLKYDTTKGLYSSFEKIKQDDGSVAWSEYPIL